MSSDKLYESISTYFWFLEGGELIVCMLINVTCLWYVLFCLKINVYISRILSIAVTGTLICQAVNFASVVLITQLKTLSIAWCPLIVIPKAINGLITTHFTMAIAVVRYYLASTTAKVEAPNHTLIKAFIASLSCLIIGYALAFTLILTLSDTLVVSPLTAACAGRTFHFEPTTAAIMSTCYICIVVGLVNDIAMARFLKNQNKIAPLELSVWVSGVPLVVRPLKQVQKFESKLSVPVKATGIGGCLFFFLLIMLGFILNNVFHGSLSFTSLSLLAVVLLLYEIYLPIIVLATIKSNDKKLKNAIKPIYPPIGLHFHD